MVLHSRAAFEALFENRYGRTFLRAVPGLHQWAVLGKAWFHSQERLPNGKRRFDTVILDAPATGHALEMLRVPKLLTEIAPVGLLRRDAENAWQTFVAPERSGVVLVTLAEELAVSETLSFIADLEQLELPVAQVFVNACLEAFFSQVDRERLLAACVGAEGGARDIVGIATDRAARECAQREQLQRLRQACTLSIGTLSWAESAATGDDPEPLVRELLALVDGSGTPA
jgi:anion-transporting  ArsA/GET3 family ATPase